MFHDVSRGKSSVVTIAVVDPQEVGAGVTALVGAGVTTLVGTFVGGLAIGAVGGVKGVP
jgi:hypothetical protein